MESLPNRVAIFARENGTGLPIARMPVYAEIVVRSETVEPAVEADPRLNDAIMLALRRDAPENLGQPQPVQRLTDVIGQEIARALGLDADTVLRAGDPGEFIAKVIGRARATSGGAQLRSLDSDTLRRAVRDAVRREAGARDLHLQPPPEPIPTLWAYPLGVLASDHTGYLSFDLSRLPATVLKAVATAVRARQLDPTAALNATILIHPYGVTSMVFDAISQGRFTLGAIVTRLELAKPLIPDAVLNLALPAMQRPSLDDWRISPGSFATNPGSLVGADGCESILPANVSLQEYYLYQVVRLTDVAPPVAAVSAGQVQFGIINEYRVAWNPLGHSLGQILYSLPLAPGESVNLAVVDWTRRDEAQRKERTTVDEQLIHNEHRDRVISETVDAAVREYQHGSSFMGGIAGAAGASFFGLASAGIAGSLGGSTSNSSGSRNVVANTVQKVNDNITQVSSASRELQSTVVVQSTQSEKETIETRTVANYNHSHALTILYYEVLRHYRVSTELVRRRPAVLIKIKTDWFAGVDAENNARNYRKALEPALLDPRVAAGFDALDRFEHRSQVAKVLSHPPTPAPPPAPPAPGPGDRKLEYFIFEMKTGEFFSTGMNDHDHIVEVTATLVGPAGVFDLKNSLNDNLLNQRGSFRQPGAINTFVAVLPTGQSPIAWKGISQISFQIYASDINDSEQKVSFSYIKVTARDVDGGPIELISQSYEQGDLIITERAHIILPTHRPPASPLPAPFVRPAEEIEDEVNRTRLLQHLKEHAAHYSRAIYFSREGLERAAELDAIKLADGSNVLEKMENRPIEMIGDYMAFPGTDRAWEDKIVSTLGALEPDDIVIDERLVSLPTRGVFAEAMLGHCNASEEIDNTRFWDWQQSPIPHMATEIAPITAVTPQPQQQNLGATPFPASIVNIVNPPSAPDPTGMSAAMNLLATSNIFRDMSGRAEVADILKNLADNAVKIASVATAARAGQSGTGGSSGGKSRGTSTGGGSIGGPRAMPNQPSATNRDLQDFGSVLGRAQADNLITPEAARKAFGQAVDAATGGLDLQQAGDTYVRPAYTPSELAGIIGETIAADALIAQNHIVFTDWRKHVSGTGFDMVSYNRATGELWIIDNKAQFRGIGGANALTGAQFSSYETDLRKFLANDWPVKEEGALALQALDAKKVKLVVSNGFAGEATRFTKGLFDKGLHAFDVRLARLFSTHAEWEPAYKALTLRKGVRLTGTRGAATLEANLLTVAVALGAGMFMLSSGVQLKQIASEIVAQFAVDAILSRLPGGLFAGFVIGMKSDQYESPEHRETRLLNDQIDVVMQRIPGIDTLPAADIAASRDAVRQILQKPIIIEDPTANNPRPLLPGLKNPRDYQGPIDA